MKSNGDSDSPVYQFKKDSDGEEISCFLCHAWPAKTTHLDMLGRGPENLCRFCYETELGHLIRHDQPEKPLARAMAQALNVLLNQINKKT